MDLTDRQELLRAAVTYAPELTRFIRGQLPDADDALDLMQELYLALLKVQSLPEAIRHPKAYLFKIAANLAHQHRQRIKSQPRHVALDDVPAEVLEREHSTVDGNAPEAACVLAERLTQLEQRLNQLSPKVQAAVVWHHRDGYTCEEISKKLSVVTHRVKKYLVRGLNHCRSLPATEQA